MTDIERDGALGGPAADLYREIIAAVPQANLIASGGVSSLREIAELELRGCTGVIVGKAIYEGCISLEELGEYAG